MKRRDFLKQCAVVATGVGFGSSPTRNLYASTRPESFAVQLVTDDPDRGLLELEALASRFAPATQLLHYREHRLAGQHLGDVVLYQNGQLLDYRQQGDRLSESLRRIAGRLRLPRALESPYLLQLTTSPAGGQTGQAVVYSGETRLATLDLRKPVDELYVAGAQGGAVVRVADGEIRVLEAGCKHQTCVNMGGIRRPGQHLACIPNRLHITIAGLQDDVLDALAF